MLYEWESPHSYIQDCSNIFFIIVYLELIER